MPKIHPQLLQQRRFPRIPLGPKRRQPARAEPILSRAHLPAHPEPITPCSCSCSIAVAVAAAAAAGGGGRDGPAGAKGGKGCTLAGHGRDVGVVVRRVGGLVEVEVGLGGVGVCAAAGGGGLLGVGVRHVGDRRGVYAYV
jgi:hypothetical protein